MKRKGEKRIMHKKKILKNEGLIYIKLCDGAD